MLCYFMIISVSTRSIGNLLMVLNIYIYIYTVYYSEHATHSSTQQPGSTSNNVFDIEDVEENEGGIILLS